VIDTAANEPRSIASGRCRAVLLRLQPQPNEFETAPQSCSRTSDFTERDQVPLSFEKMKDYIVNELGAQDPSLVASTLLFSTGLIDSFALVSLMMFIENETGVLIAPTDVNLENFDSIARILEYLSRTQV
jgi:acyl carrier protein